MKLNEITSSKTPADIKTKLGIPKTAFKVGPTGLININWTKSGAASCGPSADLVENGELTVKFGTVVVGDNSYFGAYMLHDLKNLAGMTREFLCGTFNVGYCGELTSLVGGPKTVRGDYWVHQCSKLESLKGLPGVMTGTLTLSDLNMAEIDFLPTFFTGCLEINRMPNFVSLVGLETVLGTNFSGMLSCDFDKIERGGLGLILVPGLSRLTNNKSMQLPKQFQIIQNYLGRPDDIFECQAELIENNFEAYAQL